MYLIQLIYFIDNINVLNSVFCHFDTNHDRVFLRQHDQDRRESRPPSRPWVHSGSAKQEVEQHPGSDRGEHGRSRVPAQDKHTQQRASP